MFFFFFNVFESEGRLELQGEEGLLHQSWEGERNEGRGGYINK